MKKREAVFAGSFDPFTKGHLDILEKATELFDKVHVLVALNPDKEYLFSESERLEMIRNTVAKCAYGKKITACIWHGYLFEYCEKVGANYIVKGLRNSSDFDYEKDLALKTRALCGKIETVFFLPSEKYGEVSSTCVRKKIKEGADLSNYVPETVIRVICREPKK